MSPTRWMSPGRIARWAPVWAVAGVLGCGAGRFGLSEACRPRYDACINNCSAACERGAGLAAGPTASGDTIDTWDGRCADCVERCRDQIKDCDR